MPYVLTGQKWAAGDEAEIVVSWSFADYNFSSHSDQFSNYPEFESSIPTAMRDLVRQAFGLWDDACGVRFVEIGDATDANIRIGNDLIDGSGSTLAICSSWYFGSSFMHAAIRMDDDSYAANNNFYGTVIHEIGHAIGLDHSPGASDIMYYLNDGQTTLSADDIAGAVSLYGLDQAANANVINGGDAAETLNGTSASETIYGGLGADTINGNGGDDIIFGGQGSFSDRINGGDGSDQIYGGDGDDAASGGLGNDIIGGGAGTDMLNGSDGNDRMFGGGGIFADFMTGGAGDDISYSGAGLDTLFGGDGADTMGAGVGADDITGGRGNDIIYLGANDGAADLYRAVTSNGHDMLFGFEDGRDRIDVSALGIRSVVPVGSTPSGDAVVQLSSGNSITLIGVAPGSVDASDFVFA